MRKYSKWILTAATVIWCLVIWHFSLAPATESSATSGTVRQFCNALLTEMGIPFQFTSTMVRKIAHFAEFFVLGVLSCATLLAHRMPLPMLLAAGAAFLVAAVDECIQMFVPGRGPGVLDVLLDTAGGTCGALAFWGIFLLILYMKKKRKEKSEKMSKTS